jgi:hypothetical protein
MKAFCFMSAFLAVTLFAVSCNNDADDHGHSTPIDSTNLNGTASATYGGDNPANDQDTVYENSSDTATGRMPVNTP